MKLFWGWVGPLCLLALGLQSCSSTRVQPQAIDISDVQKQLLDTGCVGWVHASVSSKAMYVFTYRNPHDFFDYVMMSLVSDDPAIQKQLAGLNRHDQVQIKGTFLDNASPQKHIRVSSITSMKKYESGYPTDPYEYQAKIPRDLLRKDHETFLVHAIGGEGHVLVVEYKDAVIPIYVKNATLTAGLYRNDVVQIQFLFQDYPERPLHLAVNETTPDPIKVVDSIEAKNGKPASIEGALVMFTQSPEIKFNVFAVQELLPNGLNRQYTLVNMESPEVFMKIRALLQTSWDRYPGQYTNARNKLLSKVIRVKVNGIYNEIDPSQANAQILLSSIDSVVIQEGGAKEVNLEKVDSKDKK
jgi:hypothetical protein